MPISKIDADSKSKEKRNTCEPLDIEVDPFFVEL
jgi:hypothetical protein